ncbi:MAG TPA: hypothetical protein VFE14_05675, partial [Micromonosporaceae bacterium]|nr:hypothetical protein [Micromonosporaceae bacterium]
MFRSRTRQAALSGAVAAALVIVLAGVSGDGFTAVAGRRAAWVNPPAWNQPGQAGTPTASAPPARGAFAGWSDPALVGKPYGSTVSGLLTFRGNPTRTYYGMGPVPRTTPPQRWRFPKSGGLCSESTDQHGTRIWCGSGWTGQPAVFERNGRTWVVFGAYDRAIHFVDAATGERILPDFPTGDIIKGSVTIDPDGFPLVYSGSRDNYYRIIAIDRGQPVELWKLWAHDVSPTLWNDDWDGAGIVLGD